VRTGITTPILYARVVRLPVVSITPGRTLSDYLRHTLVNYTFPSLIMSKSVMLSLLSQGNTGSEILSILDTLIDDNQQSSEYNEPTLNPIEF